MACVATNLSTMVRAAESQRAHSMQAEPRAGDSDMRVTAARLAQLPNALTPTFLGGGPTLGNATRPLPRPAFPTLPVLPAQPVAQDPWPSRGPVTTGADYPIKPCGPVELHLGAWPSIWGGMWPSFHILFQEPTEARSWLLPPQFHRKYRGHATGCRATMPPRS